MNSSINFTSIIRQFLPDINPKVEKYGSGHIHDTYQVEDRNNRGQAYLLQRINTHIFRNPRD